MASIKAECPAAFVQRLDGRVYAVIPAGDGPDAEDRAVASASVLAKRLQAHAPVGLSAFHRNASELGRAIEEADLIINVLGSSELSPDSLADGTYRLLVRLLASDPEQLDAFYEESVAPLARYDEQYRTDLVGTLAAYLDHDGKLGAAAQALYAHRHTVAYRLERIRELTKLDPAKYEDRERLSLGLKIHRLTRRPSMGEDAERRLSGSRETAGAPGRPTAAPDAHDLISGADRSVRGGLPAPIAIPTPRRHGDNGPIGEFPSPCLDRTHKDRGCRAPETDISNPQRRMSMSRNWLPGAVMLGLVVMLVLPALALADGSTLVAAESDKGLATEVGLNSMWIIVAGVLVMFMQAGFAFLEIGFVRGKNAGSVIAKILTNFSIAGLGYWAVGFALAFGAGGSIIGTHGWFVNGFNASKDFALAYPAGGVTVEALWFFQFVFCAVSLAIVWGTTLERIKFGVYIIYGIIFSTVIYPIVSHWIFGGGWLATTFKMQDFAGSTVVHLIGATGALAALLHLGPRKGKYSADGTPRAIPGHNMPLFGLGILILWLGWFGFNPGSTLNAIDGRFPEVVVVTLLAGCAGVLAALGTMYYKSRRSTSACPATGRSRPWWRSPHRRGTSRCGRRRSSARWPESSSSTACC